VTPAESVVTSKTGVTWKPSKPVALLDEGVTRLATNLALFGMLALRPYFTVALPENAALTPTSYEMMAPSEKIPATAMPASGMGTENKVFE